MEKNRKINTKRGGSGYWRPGNSHEEAGSWLSKKILNSFLDIFCPSDEYCFFFRYRNLGLFILIKGMDFPKGANFYYIFYIILYMLSIHVLTKNQNCDCNNSILLFVFFRREKRIGDDS